MVEQTTPERIAEIVEPDNGSVTLERVSDDRVGRDRYKYTYDEIVHAHKIPDGYEVVGFGSRWFHVSPIEE